MDYTNYLLKKYQLESDAINKPKVPEADNMKAELELAIGWRR